MYSQATPFKFPPLQVLFFFFPFRRHPFIFDEYSALDQPFLFA